MKNKIRELTDRNKGISNAEREKKYQVKCYNKVVTEVANKI